MRFDNFTVRVMPALAIGVLMQQQSVHILILCFAIDIGWVTVS